MDPRPRLYSSEAKVLFTWRKFISDSQVLLVVMTEKVKVKVKCTLVQALRLCTGCTAHSGSRGIALLFHDHGTRRV